MPEVTEGRTGWTPRRPAPGLLFVHRDLDPEGGGDDPWFSRVACPQAPPPEPVAAWTAWANAQVDQTARDGGGLVVSAVADVDGPSVTAVIAVDDRQPTTIFQRWAVVEGPIGPSTVVAFAGMRDRDWPQLRHRLAPIVDRLIGA